MSHRLKLSASGARALLAGTWFSFFVLQIGIVLTFYVLEWMEGDTVRMVLRAVSDLYAPYVGAITLFYWAKRPEDAKSSEVRSPGAGFVLAFAASLVWNLALLAFTAPLFLGVGSIEGAAENMQMVGGLLSWLVAGAIGFYFARPMRTPTEEPTPA